MATNTVCPHIWLLLLTKPNTEIQPKKIIQKNKYLLRIFLNVPNVYVTYFQTNDAVGDHWNWAYFVPLIVIGSQTGKTK